MTHMIDEVINDLLAATPREVLITPPPYNERQTLNEKLLNEASPKEQTEYQKKITKHYYTAAIRIYWLFEMYRIEQ
ncbi:36984_t:CDS:2, partial [Racocetra persica]